MQKLHVRSIIQKIKNILNISFTLDDHSATKPDLNWCTRKATYALEGFLVSGTLQIRWTILKKN